MPVTDYNAGIDSSEFTIAAKKEVSWGTNPAGGSFSTIRILSESLSESKTRVRPQEINADGYAQAAVTTQVAVAGDINYAFSDQNVDMFLESMLNGEFTEVDITGTFDATVTTNRITDNLAGGAFANLVEGQWIIVGGFTNGANNGVMRIVDKVDNDTIEVSATLATEAGGGDETIQSRWVKNGTDVVSITIEKNLSDADDKYLLYQGCYVTSGTMNFSVGDFAQGSFSIIGADETNYASTQTGGIDAAGTGVVYNNVNNFNALNMAGTAFTGTIQSVELNVTKNNARSQYGIGSAAAQGMGRGTIEVSGSMSVYFEDFTEYTKYKNETAERIELVLNGPDNETWVISLPETRFMNPQIVAGGADQDVLATFDIECSQDTSISSPGDHTIGIARLDAP